MSEIVVTARRRSEDLRNVPIAITAVGGAALQKKGLTDIRTIAEQIPQVTINSQANGTGAIISVRGIGSSASEPAFEQSVALNIDGMLINRPRVIQQGFFDLSQVEVLKGPQALYFGKNSPGGVISVDTAQPTNYLSGYIRASNEFVAQEPVIAGAISDGLTDNLSVRLAFESRNEQGYIKNDDVPIPSPIYPGLETPGRGSPYAPHERELIGRASVLWKPTSNLTASLKVTPGYLKTGGAFNDAEIVACGAPTPGLDCVANGRSQVTDFYPQLSNKWPGSNDGRQFLEFKSLTSVAKVDYKTDDMLLTSTTGYFHSDQSYFLNSSIDPIFETGNASTERFESISQELRGSYNLLSNLTVIGGFYYQHTKSSDDDKVLLGLLPPDPVTGNVYSSDRLAYLSDTTYSGFVEGVWKVFKNVEIDAGVRYTDDQKSINESNQYVTVFLAPSLLATPYLNSQTEKNWSPQVTVSYHPTHRSTLYIGYRTGFKAGGFAAPEILGADTSSIQFGPENVKGVEGGYKTGLFNNNLKFNLAAFYYDYKGLQTELFDAATTSFQVLNAGGAYVRGIEGDGAWNVMPHLTVTGAGSYNDASFSNYLTGCYAGETVTEGCNEQANATGQFTRQQLANKQLPRAPRVAGNIGLNYDAPLDDDLSVNFNTLVTYSDKYQTQEQQDPRSVQSSYVTFDAGVALESSKGWTLSLIGRNLTNERVIQESFDRPGSGGASGFATGIKGDVAGIFARPREVLLQLLYRF